MTNETRKIFYQFMVNAQPKAEVVPPDFYHAFEEQTVRTERTIPTRNGETTCWLIDPKGRKKNGAVLIYFNGAGYCYPHTLVHTSICRRIAAECGILVVDMDYTHTSDAPFPAALHDAYDGTKWVYEHAQELEIDPGKIMVMGDSSGGCLAFGVSMLARNEGTFLPALNIMIYPVANLAADPGKRESARGEDPEQILRGRLMNWLYEDDPENLTNPLVSPRLATVEELRGMPETLLYTCSLDGQTYSDRELAANMFMADVPVTVRTYVDNNHGFIGRWRKDYNYAYADLEGDIQSCIARIDAKRAIRAEA